MISIGQVSLMPDSIEGSSWGHCDGGKRGRDLLLQRRDQWPEVRFGRRRWRARRWCSHRRRSLGGVCRRTHGIGGQPYRQRRKYRDGGVAARPLRAEAATTDLMNRGTGLAPVAVPQGVLDEVVGRDRQTERERDRREVEVACRRA